MAKLTVSEFLQSNKTRRTRDGRKCFKVGWEQFFEIIFSNSGIDVIIGALCGFKGRHVT